MNHRIRFVVALASLALLTGPLLLLFARVSTQEPGKREAPDLSYWRFAVSGDSRNCGDVIMPAIAGSALAHQARFYWHLGDLRKGYDVDEDIQHQPEHIANPLAKLDYYNIEWQDFIDNQIKPFGSLPFYVGIGNHETYGPKTREEFLATFADWLDTKELRAQRLRDDPRARAWNAYYHWIIGNVDFIYLDNATPNQFDDAQMNWFETILYNDTQAYGSKVNTLVIGMHRALPDSLSFSHSMNESPQGTWSGRRVYEDLLAAQNIAHRRVYILASHSHYYLENIYDTHHWHTNGGVLPGWIVGTAGAIRYPLPPGVQPGPHARPRVYGYLLGTVRPDGEIQFEFVETSQSDVPKEVRNRYGDAFIHCAFEKNYVDEQGHQMACSP